MKKFYTLFFLMSISFTYGFSQIEGTWKIAPEAEALGVGPDIGDFSWWSNNEDDVTTRACFFDDEFVFNADGSFQNIQGGETWLEAWQGVAQDECGAPVAPHDGSNAATWAYDATASTITIEGVGAHLGLPKVINGAEIASPADAPASITYDVALDGDRMMLDINFGAGYWRFTLQKSVASSFPGEGRWKMAPQAEALAVGPEIGDFSWWANSQDDVTARACFFDDEFVFNADGSFENVQGGETWLEAWQGVAQDECGAPVAPHDGSNAATWSYDAGASTVTLNGLGAHLGLPKVINGAEIASPADAANSITYPVTFDGDQMIVDINFGGGYWHYVLVRSGSSSALDIVKDQFTVYPNPATSEITIQSDEQIDQFIIRDVSGQVLTVKQNLSLNETIDISRFSAGFYILESRTGNQISVEKLIVK